jgi:hypothetical protein
VDEGNRRGFAVCSLWRERQKNSSKGVPLTGRASGMWSEGQQSLRGRSP